MTLLDSALRCSDYGWPVSPLRRNAQEPEHRESYSRQRLGRTTPRAVQRLARVEGQHVDWAANSAGRGAHLPSASGDTRLPPRTSRAGTASESAAR